MYCYFNFSHIWFFDGFILNYWLGLSGINILLLLILHFEFPMNFVYFDFILLLLNLKSVPYFADVGGAGFWIVLFTMHRKSFLPVIYELSRRMITQCVYSTKHFRAILPLSYLWTLVILDRMLWNLHDHDVKKPGTVMENCDGWKRS